MAQLRKLSEPSELEAAKRAWERVFASADPFGWPFRHEIKARMVFCPTDGYYLSRQQYTAMIGAAQAVGDTGFFVVVTESRDPWAPGHDEDPWQDVWWCEFPSYEEYRGITLALENAIYSRHGLWGVLVSHEDHAVVGGSDAFVAAIQAAYPGWRQDVVELREIWKGNPNGAWVEAAVGEIERG